MQKNNTNQKIVKSNKEIVVNQSRRFPAARLVHTNLTICRLFQDYKLQRWLLSMKSYPKEESFHQNASSLQFLIPHQWKVIEWRPKCFIVSTLGMETRHHMITGLIIRFSLLIFFIIPREYVKYHGRLCPEGRWHLKLLTIKSGVNYKNKSNLVLIIGLTF